MDNFIFMNTDNFIWGDYGSFTEDISVEIEEDDGIIDVSIEETGTIDVSVSLESTGVISVSVEEVESDVDVSVAEDGAVIDIDIEVE